MQLIQTNYVGTLICQTNLRSSRCLALANSDTLTEHSRVSIGRRQALNRVLACQSTLGD